MERQPYTKEWLEKACKESYSLREVLIKAGRGSSRWRFLFFIKEENSRI